MKISTPKHIGIIKQGKFIPNDPEFFKYDLQGFEGQFVEVTCSECKRSNQANAYWWGVVVKIFTDFFNKEKSFGKIVSKDFVHEILTTKFAGTFKQILPGGEVLELRNSTAKMKVKEFSDLIEYAIEWGESFFSLEFPEPPPKEKTK